MSAATEDPKRRYADLVKLNGLSSKFISRDTERRLLEDGVVRFDLTLDESRGVLKSVADDHDFVFESDTARRISQVLARHAGKKGYISKKQFNQAADILKDFSDDAIGDAEARRQIKRIMIDNGWKPRRAGMLRSRGWYKSVEV